MENVLRSVESNAIGFTRYYRLEDVQNRYSLCHAAHILVVDGVKNGRNRHLVQAASQHTVTVGSGQQEQIQIATNEHSDSKRTYQRIARESLPNTSPS